MTIEQAKQTITNSTLPADIKAQALENLRLYPSGNNDLTGNPISLSIDMFSWMQSAEGPSYWRLIFNRAEHGEFDPQPAEESVEEIADKLYQDFIYEWIRHKSTRTEADILAKYLSTKLASLEKRIVSLEKQKV